MARSVNIFTTPAELARAMAEILADEAEKAKISAVKMNIALSGGETPKLMFMLLAERYPDSAGWKSVQFFWVDERCVPPGDPESNYGAVNRLFLSKTDIPESSVHRIRGENNPQKEAERYSEEINVILPQKNNLPAFDHIILGIGDDGHTASIFPGRIDLFESVKLCEATEHPGNGQKRISMTGRLINNAQKITFLVSGKNKSAIVRDILCRDNDYEKYPAAHVDPRHGELIWMMDAGAASLYKNSRDFTR